MRATLMHNPEAGHAGIDEDDLVRAVKDAGYKVEYQSVKKKGWKDALEEDADLIVVAGGDGTVAKVATAIAGRGVPIAVLPCGTANNIATSLGIEGDPLEIIRTWEDGRRRKFDIGVASGPWGEARFLEAVGFGLFPTSVALVESTEDLEKPEGRDAELARDLNFLRLTLDTTRARERRIVLDGEDLTGEYFLAEIMNIQSIGPNLRLAPDASPGDGRLNLVLLGERERPTLEAYLDRLRAGDGTPPGFPVRSGRRIEIRWDGSPLHVDSDIYAEPALATADDESVVGVWLDSEVELLVGST